MHVACLSRMRKKKNVNNDLMGEPEGNMPFGRENVNVSIILKRILKT